MNCFDIEQDCNLELFGFMGALDYREWVAGWSVVLTCHVSLQRLLLSLLADLIDSPEDIESHFIL
jgi:hypothetical protein